MTDLAKLAEPFPPTDIEWRLQSAGKNANGIWAKCLAYITNRAIMERLDQIVGPGNWRNEYREWTIGTAGVLCGLSIRIEDEWVTKWDGAEQTDVEAMKGGLSAAMKRAAVQWGIGRYLYDLPSGWAKISEQGEHWGKTKESHQGAKDAVEFRWDNPDLPSWAVPGNGNGSGPKQATPAQPLAPNGPPVTAAAPVAKPGPYAPTEKQIRYYQELADHPVFTAEERQRALTWLADKATRQTIKDQISWLKRQTETRKGAGTEQQHRERDEVPVGDPPDGYR